MKTPTEEAHKMTEHDFDRGTGWVPQLPDWRDFPLSAIMGPAPAAVLPQKVSLRAKCSPVRDQGLLGSCTGFAVTGGIEYLRRTDADELSTIYSPLHAYYHARAARGWQNADTGAYIRDIVKAMQKIGAAPESAWVYDVAKFTRKPNATAEKKAARWRLGTYAACSTLDEIVTALARGTPVVGGFTCYSSMFTREVARTGLIPMPRAGDREEGGHAVLFTGYDRPAGVLEFRNSWGVTWGDKGYGRLPFGYVSWRLASDFWALTAESVESTLAHPRNNNLAKRHKSGGLS